MHFDYVDIGTSDFETSLDVRKDREKALLIDPLFQYLKNLPDDPDTYKLNVAISNEDGWGEIYYIPEADIAANDLPYWVRGCNKLDAPHPNLTPWEHLVKRQSARIIAFCTLVVIYDIESIGHLKIDTEGHDHIILQNLLEGFYYWPEMKISKITTEYKADFKNLKEMDNAIAGLRINGYEITTMYGDNIVMEHTGE